ncbi:hypothetical protein OSB04_031049 [Centaurea solstitialis]|uniref:Protein kinase domain-containing protein n=1 Tax=Centaurea solstitialis TaxID=347529 RepID=A0AA38SKY9_9ASTR|nr:hypothetical protein OSB04_031049 [Centaurea solstitialis]
MFLVTGLIILMTIFNIIVYYLQLLQQEDCDDVENSSSLPSHQLCRRFSLAEIKLTTHDFDESFVIGKGGFGKVYKGIIDSEVSPVAIKRLNCDSSQGAPEFWTEISMLSKVRHSHIVSLIGYCKAGQEMVLVYEYMPNGSLADHLHKIKSKGRSSSLSWDERLNICIDAARGLDYLHTGTSVRQRIIHRDVKSSNILLDENLAAKISDFGLSRTGPSNLVDTTHVYTNLIRGTFGYMDEEYFLTRRLTRKSDVYAFGVVLFEVLSGRPAVNPLLEEEQRGLAGWARHCTREGTIINKLMDPCLRGKILPTCLEAFVEIADKCILKCPKDRPTMAEVVARLEYAFALQKGIDSSAVEGSTPSTTSTYDSSEISGISPEVQKVITANDTYLPHEELIDRYRPSSTASRLQQFIGRAKNKRIIRKVWSTFSAKSKATATANSIVDDDSSSESLVFYYGIRGYMRLEAHRLELDSLRVATENFSEANKIRQCAISSTYKGRLQNGKGIVVKRSHSSSQQVLQEYRNEVLLLGELEHENLIQLLGYCVEEMRVLLVFDLSVYASLDLLIFDYATRVLLDWNRRYQIILGVALGLRYIHTHAHQIVHCDVKSANIFLDKSLNPKLSDFGIARTLANNEAERHVLANDITQTRSRFCKAWLTPWHAEKLVLFEYLRKADVFAFGMLVLEIIRGQRSDGNFIHYAWRHWWKGKASNIIDPTMDVDSSIITRCIQIALLCVQEDADERPSMAEVVVMLLKGSSLTLRIPKESGMQVPSTSYLHDNENLETLEPDDENDVHVSLMEDHDYETVMESVEELNLNPR